jgi:integrase/recombinase XerC
LEIDAALQSFLEHVRHKSGSAHTVTSYSIDLRQFVSYLNKQKVASLNDVDATRIRAYLRELFNLGYSKASISRKLSSMRRFFAYLRQLGVTQADVGRGIHGPSMVRNIPRALSPEAVEKMFEAAECGEFPERDVAMLELLYSCGLRVSELVGLKWDGVDLEERWLIVMGKGDKERRVPFGDCAKKALSALRNRDASRDALGQYVFTSRGKDRHLTERTAHRVITSMAARCGLGNVTPHTLRHSCATHLLEKGAPIKFVQDFLGHESMATTQIYLTISASWMKESYVKHHPRAAIPDLAE